MLVAELIRVKRDGGRLPPSAMEQIARGLADGSIGDAQAAAFAMAVCWRGLDDTECAALTGAMARSGEVLDWDRAALDGPVLDKHSTGGIGDLVSLVLAPAVAACGGYVPMIAGRGLGHTGGTIDKLEAIAGYDCTPDLPRFRAIVRSCGCAIIGQTATLAPADGRLYGIRDVTATVESLPLITASILSKKLAAGLDGLVMDVKTGSGAFLPDAGEAEALARTLASVGAQAGLPVVALLTDMDQPLAPAAGNAVEVRVALDHLTGRRVDPRVDDVVRALGSAMLQLGGLAASPADGEDRLRAALRSGAAAERFARMVAGLGGPADLLERYETSLPRAPVVRPVPAARTGIVAKIDTRALGLAIVALGGGRTHPGERIDPRVGLTEIARVGTPCRAGEPIAFVHAADDAAADRAMETLTRAMDVADTPPPARPLVGQRITA